MLPSLTDRESAVNKSSNKTQSKEVFNKSSKPPLTPPPLPPHAPKGDGVKALLRSGSEMWSEPQGRAPRALVHERTCWFSPTASSVGFHERRGAAHSAKHTIAWETKQNFLSALYCHSYSE